MSRRLLECSSDVACSTSVLPEAGRWRWSLPEMVGTSRRCLTSQVNPCIGAHGRAPMAAAASVRLT